MSGQGSTGNVIAALCNFPLPGLGQLVQGRILPALFFFLVTAGLYALGFLIIPWLLALPFHLWSILDAALYKPKSV